MKLLEDVFIIENLQIINEGAGSGPMKIRGCFQRADEANNNKRIYRKPLLEREISKLAEAMTERRLMGELDHPQNDSVKLSNVSHLITDLKMKGNELVGEAEILDTPSGKVAKALIDGGVKIGVSSRGMGTVTEEMDGKRYVNEDFKLITWDIVADPSTRGAFPGLTESTQIQEIIDTVYPEAQKVKNFTTLLKEELTVESTPAGRRRSKKIGTEAAREIAELEPAPGFPIDQPEAGKQDDIRASAIERGRTEVRRGKVRVRVQARRQKLGLKPGQTTRGRASLGLGGGDAALQKLRRSQSTNDSTQFVNFMRDKLNEKTRWQKEAEKRAKPSGDGGEIATFQTMSGSRRGSMRGLIPDLTPATVRSYKAASAPGGLGRKAAAAADDASKPSKKPGIVGRVVSKVRSVLSTKKQKAKRVAKRVALKRDAQAIQRLRAARARLRKGGDSTEARPISHPGGENRNPLARGMPVLKRVEDRLKSGNYRG